MEDKLQDIGSNKILLKKYFTRHFSESWNLKSKKGRFLLPQE
jgi:hypothetical protein